MLCSVNLQNQPVNVGNYLYGNTMNVFYDRQESDKSIIYAEKPYSLYFVVLVAIVTKVFEQQLLSYTGIESSYFFGGALLILVICRLLFMVPMRKEIAIAIAAGNIERSGSRFSLTNPLTTTIAK